MTPHRSDIFDYKVLEAGLDVTIANGKKLQVSGKGKLKLTGLDGLLIKMLEVLHIPGFDRQLFSVGKLATRGTQVKFQNSSCAIWNADCAVAIGKKFGKAYVLGFE